MIEIHACGTCKDLLSEKEEIKFNKITMIQEKNSFDDVTKQEKKNIIKIGNILTIGGSGSGKRNSLFDLIIHQPDIDKTSLYAKYPYEGKYLTLADKRESARLKHLNGSKALIEYSNDIDDIYKNTEACNPNKKRQILVVLKMWLMICIVIKNLIQ